MNDQQLTRTLQSVGMRCFVKYLERVDDSNLPEQIKDAEGYTDKACASRASGIRSIVRSGRANDALAIIANSKKVDAETRTTAAALLARRR